MIAATKYIPTLSLLILLVLLSQVLSAQSYTISGSLQDSLTKEPVFGATITAVRQDSMVEKFGCISNEHGLFSLQLKKGDYRLQFSHVGYAPFNNVEMRVDSSRYLGIFYLGEQTLKAIEVEAQLVAVLQKGDTTIFNAAAFKTRANASSRDLIAKMPAMQTDGEITAQGEPVVEILVDGVPFYTQNQAEALDKLPAEMVDKVEVYQYQSEHAKASGIKENEQKKTINIVTKKELRESIFGEGELAGASNLNPSPLYYSEAKFNIFRNKQRSSLQLLSGNINDTELKNNSSQITPHHSLALSFDDKWGNSSFSAAYNVTQRRQKQGSTTERNYLFAAGIGKHYEELLTSLQTNLSHILRLRFDHKRKRQHLMFNSNLSFNKEIDRGDNRINLSDATENPGDSRIQSSIGFNKSANYMLNFLYSYHFSKKNRVLTFSIGVENHAGRDSIQRKTLHHQWVDETLDSNRQLILGSNNTGQLKTKISYAEPLSEASQLQFQLNFDGDLSYQKKYNFILPSQPFAELYLDSSLSTISQRKSYTYELNPAYNYKKDKINFSISLNMVWEQVKLLDKLRERNAGLNYLRFRPTTQIRWQFTKKAFLQILYNMRTRSPGLREQQAVIDNSNPSILYKGNPNLKVELTHFASFILNKNNPEKGNMLLGQIMAIFYQSKISNSLYIVQKDTSIYGTELRPGMQLQSPVNLKGAYRLQAMFNYHQQIKKLPSNFNFTLLGIFEQNPNIYNGMIANTQQFNLNSTLQLTSNISKKIDINAQLTGFATALLSKYSPTALQWQQSFNLTAFWSPYKRLNLQTSLYQQYTNLTKNAILHWNIGIGTNFLKKDRGELALHCYNILNQSNSRQITSNLLYSETVQSQNLLGTYFVLKFTYHLQPTPLKVAKSSEK